MLTRAGLNCASAIGVAGNGFKAGASSAAKATALQPGSFLNGRWLRSSNN
ncbi:hypothetical protein ROSA5918_26455 [Roseateles saccharophilus]